MIWGEPIRTFLRIVHPRHGARLNNAQKAAPHRYALLVDKTYRGSEGGQPPRTRSSPDHSTSKLDPSQWISNLRLPNGHAPRIWTCTGTTRSPAVIRTSRIPHAPGHATDFSDLPRLAGWVDRFLRRGMPLFLSEFAGNDGPGSTRCRSGSIRRWPAAGCATLCAYRGAGPVCTALGWVHVYDNTTDSNGGLLTIKGKPKPTYWAFLRG